MSQISRYARNRSGNVAIIFALSAPVLLFGVGFAIDYGLYARAKVRVEMLADEATLAITSASGMQMTSAAATTFAANLFCSQAVQIPNYLPNSVSACVSKLTINVSASSGIYVTTASNNVRQATLNYSGTYSPMFAVVLNNTPTLPLSGTSTAQSASASALNTNFYVLLDNQGSMALPDTAAGIAKMESLTTQQLAASNGNPAGCAFACHEAAPNNPVAPFAADTQGNPCVTGTSGNNCPTIDNYTIARNNNITLRFDDVTTAMSALITDAQSEQSQSNPAPTYQFAVYSVDAPYTQGLYNIMPLTSNYVSTWAADASKLQLYTVYSDGGACATVGANPCGSGTAIAQVNRNGTIYPYYNVGFFSSPIGTEMSSLASTIPSAGDGKPGDTPKQTLMIVTDGVEDTIVSSNLSITVWDSTALAACTTLRNKGVQIAILYTQYFPTPGFWLYDNYVANFQGSIGSTLQSCATPGLFMSAGLNDNITQDLLTLFNMANQSSKLTQ